MCSSLAEDIDTIRKEYWGYISRSLTNKYGDKESSSDSGVEAAAEGVKWCPIILHITVEAETPDLSKSPSTSNLEYWHSGSAPSKHIDPILV